MRDRLVDPLWPSVRGAVLALMLMDPDREWHLREIARRTGTALSATRRELIALAEAGILRRREESRRSYYRANTECPIFTDLRQIVLKTIGLADVLREALDAVPGIEVAFVFGSMASGSADSASDVDVLIIGEVSFAEVSGALHVAAKRLNREITPTVYSWEEFRRRRAEGQHFLASVLSGPKIMLTGGDDDLERMGRAAS